NYIDRETPTLHRMGVRLRHLGDIKGLSKSLQKKVRAAMDLTRQNIAITVNVALNYGGRQDLLEAIRSILASGLPAEQVDERVIANHLGTNGIPEPDLVIRTSGEKRLSNFLIWETAYSELFFTTAMWPDFTPATLDEALDAYAQRKRRFGLTESASDSAAAGR
ncbi:MAG: polyprenyl diphosphate synthase, partial [Anaerolineales bacterium]|nr:polyprenyl diphosphate synthase [Anaerolineales bacterium]